MKAKSQAAMEYLVLTGFALTILTTLLIATYVKMSDTQKQVDVDAAERAVNELKRAADFVYVNGHPTKLTLNIYLPPDIDPTNSSIDGKTIDLAMRSGSTYTDVWRPTRGNVTWNRTAIPHIEGYYVIVVESTEPDIYGNAGVINIHKG